MKEKVEIFQTKEGALELKTDGKETIWANLNQIAMLFERDKSAISRHLKNIFNSQELQKEATVAFFATVKKEGNRKVSRNIEYYNLDVILSIGYRVNSVSATKFRIWSNQILKKHIKEGYTINEKVLQNKKQQFLKTIENLKILNSDNIVETDDILSIIQSFSNTFFTLENYDKNNFPKIETQSKISASAKDLKDDLQTLKRELIRKKEATELFAQEKKHGSLEGIFGNVFQSVFEQDAYPSIEEKAAHLLYFIVKNHPFNDGNKRSGAFSFIWLLKKSNYNFQHIISPETLTTLTLLIALSNPDEKDKMIGLILLLFKTT